MNKAFLVDIKYLQIRFARNKLSVLQHEDKHRHRKLLHKLSTAAMLFMLATHLPQTPDAVEPVVKRILYTYTQQTFVFETLVISEY